MNNPDHAAALDSEITRLLHLAIIAQLQAWEALNNLEAVLETSYVVGSPEWQAIRLDIGNVVLELTGDPGESLPEALMEADAGVLREMLIFANEERQKPKATTAEVGLETDLLRLGDEGPIREAEVSAT